MADSGRKHGPFDFRYPVRATSAPPVWELEHDREGRRALGWSRFAMRFFPARRRHDFQALAAYEAYREALDRAAAREHAGAMPPSSSSLLGWESEGGAVERDDG
ncbi:MAG TPA: hypothetical protein VFB26_01670 [Gaiellaceae bacterium]|nr:hypothetical protein [Gaiellaceae bacterium]